VPEDSVSVPNGGQRLASRSERFSSGVLDNQRSQKSTGGWWLVVVVVVVVVQKVRGKGKGHPTSGHEGPKGQKYSSTPSLTSALDGGRWSTPRPGRFTPGNKPPIVQEAGWASKPVWTGAENLYLPPGFDTLTAYSESLYRLRYSGPRW
jgi:hypothetical protein